MSLSIVAQPAPPKTVLVTKVIIYHTQVSSSQVHGCMCSMCCLHARKICILPFTASIKILKMISRNGYYRVNNIDFK